MRNFNNLNKVGRPHVIDDLRDMVRWMDVGFGDKPMYKYKSAGTVVPFSYSEFKRRHDEFGTALFELGLDGTAVAVIGDTHPLWVVTFVSTINSGSVSVPLDKECDIAELVKFLNRAHCTAVVYTSKFNGQFTAHKDELPEIKYFIPIEPDDADTAAATDKALTFSDACALGRKSLDGGSSILYERKIDMEALCAILFTSGTTGTSKGVMLCQRNLTAAANSSAQSMQYDSRCEYVSVLPIHHTYELTCAHLAALGILGATTFINDGLKYVARNFKEQKPNTLVLVPLYMETIYKRIWDEIKKKGMERKVRAAMALSDGLLKVGVDVRGKLFSDVTAAFGGRLTSIVVGGAALDPKMCKDFYSFGITVLQGYGITECSPLVAVNRPGHVKFDSVGWPVENCEVKIDRSEDASVKEGEILVKGDNVMMGYYEDPDATAAVFTQDGWFRTGDIGRIDDDGYIMITGRKKNVIILSNGKNIYPEELEEHLTHLHYLSEYIVIGRNNAIGEPVLTLIAVPNREITGDESDESILARLKEDVNAVNRSLPAYKHINDFELRGEAFEKTPSRKIKRFLVK